MVEMSDLIFRTRYTKHISVAKPVAHTPNSNGCSPFRLATPTPPRRGTLCIVIGYADTISKQFAIVKKPTTDTNISHSAPRLCWNMQKLNVLS